MADASESSTESEYYDEDVKAEQVKVEKTEVKDTSTGHSPESNSLVESAFPLSAPTQFVSPFAALAQTPPLASASGKSVSTEYTALSRSKQLKLQTADLVAEHKTLKLNVIALRKNSQLVEKAFNKLVKIPVLPSGRSWDDIGKNPAHRAMIKRMRNMKRAEQRYNTKNSNAAKRKPLPPAKTLALTQELVDLDRLTIQTLTEQIMYWVYHLQQEDVQLSKEAEAHVAKYKRDKGSETALEELVEELERECETVGVRANPEMPDEAITGLTCERCNEGLRYYAMPPQNRHFCPCCERLLPSAGFAEANRGTFQLCCRDCSPRPSCSDELDAVKARRADFSRLQAACTAIRSEWKAYRAKTKKNKGELALEHVRLAADDLLNALIVQDKELLQRIKTDLIPRRRP